MPTTTVASTPERVAATYAAMRERHSFSLPGPSLAFEQDARRADPAGFCMYRTPFPVL